MLDHNFLLFFLKVVGIPNVNDNLYNWNLHHIHVKFSCGVHQRGIMGFGCSLCNGCFWVYVKLCGVWLGLEACVTLGKLMKKMVEFMALASYWF